MPRLQRPENLYATVVLCLVGLLVGGSAAYWVARGLLSGGGAR